MIFLLILVIYKKREKHTLMRNDTFAWLILLLIVGYGLIDGFIRVKKWSRADGGCVLFLAIFPLCTSLLIIILLIILNIGK